MLASGVLPVRLDVTRYITCYEISSQTYLPSCGRRQHWQKVGDTDRLQDRRVNQKATTGALRATSDICTIMQDGILLCR